MPKLDKKALSLFIRTGCERQLRLTMATNQERAQQGMPGEQPPRPGLEDAARQGLRWQDEKIKDLIEAFGADAVLALPSQTRSGTDYRPIDLDANLTRAAQVVGVSQPTVFLVEASFDVTAAFDDALGIAGARQRLGIEYAALRPDLIEVLPPSNREYLEVLPDGETRVLAAGGVRRRLRVIDIKLTAEPSPGYFAEVTLYSMALAAWLKSNGRDHEFVVTSEAALWPGSHDASQLAIRSGESKRRTGSDLTPEQLREALGLDLEPVPFEVFVPEVRRFFTLTVPELLAKEWQETEYHVDNRCKSCAFLGAPWINADGDPTAEPGHCMKVADASGHLSKVAYVSRGARTALERGGIADVSALASRTSEDPALNEHHVLRGSRTVVHERARVLDGNTAAGVAPSSGTTAVMPRWADLRIHISVDFDASSAISFAFAASAFWMQPVPFRTLRRPDNPVHGWETKVFIVDQRSLAAEERELLAFLRHLKAILAFVVEADEDRGAKSRDLSGYQVYIWDQLQLKHFGRVIGRHLPAILADADVRDLAWLFPAEDLVADPMAISRQSPITVVRDIVKSLVAAPIDHYYSLLSLARHYHQPGQAPELTRFSVHPLFEDDLSDQIPSERAHEVWTRSGNVSRPWLQQLDTLKRTVATRLRAAEEVRRRLEDDLRGQLKTTAPKINLGGMKPVAGVAQMSQLWIAHAKLNAAFQELEIAQVRAMPVHERESKFRSARLVRRLTGAERDGALANAGVVAKPTDFVYLMRPESREVKLREGAFAVALAPESMPDLLDWRLSKAIDGTSIAVADDKAHVKMEKLLSMTVIAIDREHLTIVLRPDPYWAKWTGVANLLEQLERYAGIDLNSDCILDPTYTDFFLKKLEGTLKAIKNPPAAVTAESQTLAKALGDRRPKGSRKSAAVPAADLLWDAAAMHTTPVDRDLATAKARLIAHGVQLNDSQWLAWQTALTLRLQTIWGPPGTGKSKTLRAIALGAGVEAHERGRPLRLLIGASNYKALDNVLDEVATELPALLGGGADVEIHRLRSSSQEASSTAIDTPTSGGKLDQHARDLATRLVAASGITVVGSTPEQLYNLLSGATGSPMAPAFDLLLLDEASQTDVAHATLFAAAMTADATVIPAGDTKQLPPITQAEPPVGLETLVGSFLGLLENAYGVTPIDLNVNYRSNNAIVELAHAAGYKHTLRAASPNLRLNVANGQGPPAQWPAALPHTPAWGQLLDPSQPVTAFVYDDKNWSSQSNDFEAKAVACLLAELFPRMRHELLGQLDADGAPVPPAAPGAITLDEFWSRGVGVVTPHRAQQAMVLAELEHAFPSADRDLLRGAVDTVERFQGQQRDVIIVSYALGDPDAIADEDEFLMSFNRFNVAASRARAKLIVLVSQQVISHLSGEVEVLHDSKLLKQFASTFCSQSQAMSLPHNRTGGQAAVNGQHLWHP